MFSGTKGAYQSTVRNVGNTATQVVIATDPALPEINLTETFVWGRGEEKRLEWNYDGRLADKTVKLTMTYVDANGLAGMQVFELVPNFDDPYNMVEVVRRDGA